MSEFSLDAPPPRSYVQRRHTKVARRFLSYLAEQHKATLLRCFRVEWYDPRAGQAMNDSRPRGYLGYQWCVLTDRFGPLWLNLYGDWIVGRFATNHGTFAASDALGDCVNRYSGKYNLHYPRTLTARESCVLLANHLARAGALRKATGIEPLTAKG